MPSSRTALAVLPALLAGSVWSGDAPPAPTAVAKIFPASLSVSLNRRFDEGEALERPTISMSLSLTIKPLAPGLRFMACRSVVVTEAISVAGDNLGSRDRDRDLARQNQRSYGEYEQGQGRYDANLNLTTRTLPKAIARLSGVITLVVAKGVGKQAEIKPIKDFLGKPLEIVGLPDPITVTRKRGGNEGERVEIRTSTTSMDRIAKISVLNADGSERRNNSYGGGSGGDGEAYRTIPGVVDDDGGLLLALHPPSEEVQVPFTLTNLAVLPESEAAALPAVKIVPKEPAPRPASKPTVAPDKPAAPDKPKDDKPKPDAAGF